MYQYKAIVTRVIDGDSFHAQIDCGFHIFLNETFRLAGLDAPELKGEEREEGLKVKEWLRYVIEGKDVLIETEKGDKYGRWLATVYVDGIDINKSMLNGGLAKPYK